MVVQVVCPNPRCGAPIRTSGLDRSQGNHCHRCGQELAPSTSSNKDTPESSPDGRREIPPAPPSPHRLPGLVDGSSFGRYQIVRRLGQGGMGSVYLAHDSQLDRQVALKVPHFSPDDGPDTLERFQREARSAAALHHPNLCAVYDIGQVDGAPYLTMAYVEGRPLSDLIDGDTLPSQRQAAAVVRKLAQALQTAHDRGVIHRDLKPANILVSRERELVVVDFGLARREGTADARLTRSGVILGTPAYMSPEQVAGDAAAMGVGCDIYSLGVILYELLTGRLPFEGPLTLVLGRIMVAKPEPPSQFRADLDPRLEAICLKALAKKAGDRYLSMSAFAGALTESLRGAEAAASSSGIDLSVVLAEPTARHRTGGESRFGGFFARRIPIRPRSADIEGLAEVPSSHAGPPSIEPLRLRFGRWAASAGGFWRRNWPWVVAGGAPLLLFLGVVIFITTGEGTVKIELSDPKGDVAVKLDGDTITVAGLGEPLRLRVGKHHLEVVGQGFETRSESFTVKRGDNPALHVELVSKATVDPRTITHPAETRPPPASPVPAQSGVKQNANTPARSDDVRRLAYADRMVEVQLALEAKNAVRARQILAECPDDLRGWEWDYSILMCNQVGLPAESDSRVGMFVLKHQDPTFVTDLCFSPDGLTIASGGSDGIVRVYDATVMAPPSLSIPVRSWVTGVAFSPDGRRLATSSTDHVVRVWELPSGALIHVLRGHTNIVEGVAFSPDGRWIASASRDQTVLIWDASTGRQERAFRGHTSYVNSVAFSPDSNRVVSASDDRTVRVWDLLHAGQQVAEFTHDSPVENAFFDPGGRRIVSSASKATVRVCELATGKVVFQLENHEGPKCGVAFSPDGQRVATGSVGFPLRLWDSETGRELLSIRDPSHRSIWGLNFSPDGRRIASGGPGRALRVWYAPDPAARSALPLASKLDHGWISLFNGKDLTGWKTFPGQPINWSVFNGILIGSGALSNLFSVSDDYENFHFRVEARINDGGNSGQFFRAAFGPMSFAKPPEGYEAQIGSTNADKQRTGSLVNFAPVKEMLIPPNTWFTQEVIVDGRHIVIKVNDKTTVDFVDAKGAYLQGHLALQQHHAGSVVEFRKVEVKELPSSKSVNALATPNSKDAGVESGRDEILDPRRSFTNSLGMKLMLIPSGEFLMGSPDSDNEARDDERPQHRVRITRAFYLGAIEVTVGQFRHVVEATGYRTEAESDGLGGWGWNRAQGGFEQGRQYSWRNPGFLQTEEEPVTNIGWSDAIAFCNALSAIEGLRPCYESATGEPSGGDGYRLPTEAEWEYACRAGTTTLYQSGDNPATLASVGNTADRTLKEKYPALSTLEAKDGFLFTSPVGRFRPNAFGLYDMHGNVWEWCWDRYDGQYYRQSPDTNPLGPAKGERRVFRGGGWYNVPNLNRTTTRGSLAPGPRNIELGFRVVRVQPSR